MAENTSKSFMEYILDMEVIYLTLKFSPSTKENCEIIKIIYKNGRVAFSFPAKKENKHGK